MNRVDVWGLWSLFGGGDVAEKPTPGTDSDDKPFFCKWAKCDDNGTIQGDYKPIEGGKDTLPFLLDFSVPISKSITNRLGIGDKNDPRELRLPLLPDLEIGPFHKYWEKQQAKSSGVTE